MDNTAGLGKLRDLYDLLGQRYLHLEELVQEPDEILFATVPAVSSWSVAKQAHHIAGATGLMLLGIDRIAHQKAPATREGSINAMGRMLLAAGRMPRGKAQAPARTVPPETVSRSDLVTVTTTSRAAYRDTGDLLEAALASGWRVAHPYFGPMDVRQWLKLASVHADHHFRIVDDIRSALSV